MKKCPYCAEEIEELAIKCKHCNEFLTDQKKIKWYFKPYWLIIAFLCAGPLILPLVWLNPDFNRQKKIILSIIIIIVSYFAGFVLFKAINSLKDYYQLLFQQLEQAI